MGQTGRMDRGWMGQMDKGCTRDGQEMDTGQTDRGQTGDETEDAQGMMDRGRTGDGQGVDKGRTTDDALVTHSTGSVAAPNGHEGGGQPFSSIGCSQSDTAQ